MKINPIQAIDFYKAGHKFQYPIGTEYIFSNFTARSDKLAPKNNLPSDGKIVWYGLQGFVKWFLIDCFNENFFKVPKEKVIAEYNRRMNSALGTNSVDSTHIAELHDLGFLPIQIRALPEGSLVDMKVPVLTIVNTDPKFFWLTNYLETVLSAEIWKCTTSATTAYKYRELLEKYAKKTGSPLDFVLWQGHDFSFRGLSGVHDAAKSASGHLLSFYGTDTIPAMQYLEDYYGGLSTFIGGSVPASEHSTMTVAGKEGEFNTIKRLITEIYPSGVVSVVSDSYDFFSVISEFVPALKDDILARKPNENGLAKVVFRPDSGNPADILCGIAVEVIEDDIEEEDLEDYIRDLFVIDCEVGYEESADLTKYFRWKGKIYKATASAWWNSYENYCEIDSIAYKERKMQPKEKGAVETLWDIFGGTITETGHKLLNERVGLIYGDSITLDRAQDILKRLDEKGFSSANVVFGIGSYTYQHVTRDTYGFAVKSTWGSIDSKYYEIFKDPVTDSGVKKSAKGLLRVFKTDQGFEMKDQLTVDEYISTKGTDAMHSVFYNGKLENETTLEEIRSKVNKNLTLV